MRTIFTDLLYKDQIDISDLGYDEIFKNANIDTKTVTIPDLLWVATEIGNAMSTVNAVEFQILVINLASYYCNKGRK